MDQIKFCSQNLALLSTIKLYAQPVILIVSIPKSGSHLLGQIITLLTGRTQRNAWIHASPETLNELNENNFWLGHLLPTNEHLKMLFKKNYVGIFLYRDPRDQVVSLAYWLKKSQSKRPPGLATLPIPEIITKIISSFPFEVWDQTLLRGVSGVQDLYKTFLPWRNVPNMYVTQFEKLIGPKGGGSKEVQLQEIQKIATHLKIACSIDKIEEVANSFFGDTYTFRTGQIGQWKNEFSPEQKELFKKVAGQLLIDLGYESSFDW